MVTARLGPSLQAMPQICYVYNVIGYGKKRVNVVLESQYPTVCVCGRDCVCAVSGVCEIKRKNKEKWSGKKINEKGGKL